MLKQKSKKRAIKIILTILVSLILVANMPLIVEHFTETNNFISYAQDNGDDLPPLTQGQLSPSAGQTGTATTPATTGTDQTTPEVAGATLQQADEMSRNLVRFLGQAQKFLNGLLWPVLVMIGGLLDNSLLFGSGMEARLREIWIPIRNIVNILFVIALVGIALYNILGIGDENSSYSLKAILPRLVIGIIAVNFSFLGLKIFLDTINVLTTSIFALPNQVNEELANVLDDTTTDGLPKANRFCKLSKGYALDEKITPEDFNAKNEDAIYRTVASRYARKGGFEVKTTDTKDLIIQKINGSTLSKADKTQFEEDIEYKKKYQMCDGLALTEEGRRFLRQFNTRNSALAMALNMSEILFYSELEANIDNIEKLITNFFLSTLMYIIFVVSFLALFIVLLARLVVLWLAIAVSPVLILTMSVPVLKEKISGFGDLTSKFVQNAIAPLGIALAMSIGWIMLQAIKSVNEFDSNSALNFDVSNGIPVVGLNTLQDLIAALGTAGVVWLGVFAAASKTVAGSVTEAMKGFVKKAGGFVGSLPLKHLPLVPIKIGEKEDVYTLDQLGQVGTRLRGYQTEKSNKLWEDLTGKKAVGLDDKDYIKDQGNVYGWLKENRNLDDDKLQEWIGKLKTNRRKLYNSLDRNLQQSFDKVIDAKTPDELKKARNELFKRHGTKIQAATAVKGAAIPKEGKKPPTKEEPKKPTKPEDYAKVTFKRSKEEEAKALSDLYKGDDMSAAIVDLNTKIETIKGATKPEEIKESLKGLEVGGYHPTDAKQLKALLDAAKEGDVYNTILAQFKDEAELTAFLEEQTGISTAAAAPTGPTEAARTAAAPPRPPEAGGPTIAAGPPAPPTAPGAPGPGEPGGPIAPPPPPSAAA